MPFSPQCPGADVYVPDGAPLDAAFARVTHLGIGAHADDLEIMAYHGIRRGLSDPTAAFGAVVCTDGRGAPRGGAFAGMSDDRLREIRREEQREAARRGRYALAIQLDHPSEAVKRGVSEVVTADLAALLAAARPTCVYTHAPTDAHATHVGVCVATLRAIRALPAADRPREFLGCEVWRSLDWLDPRDLRRLDLGSDEDRWSELIRCFVSQHDGGRPYDAGALGRSRANAVFHDSHVDRGAAGAGRQWLALDLSPLLADDTLDLADFVRDHLARFEQDVLRTLALVRGTRPLKGRTSP